MVVCLISVAFTCSVGITCIGDATLAGKLLSENKTSYLVDFSKEAKEREYLGDLSKVLVTKNKCAKHE